MGKKYSKICKKNKFNRKNDKNKKKLIDEVIQH